MVSSLELRYRPVLRGAFFNCASFFSGNSSFCQVEKESINKNQEPKTNYMQSWALEFRILSSHQDRLNWTDLLSTPVSPVLVQTDIKASSKNRRHHSIPRRAQAGPTHAEEKKVTFINRQKYKQIISQPTNFICTSPDTEAKVE